MLCTNQKLLYEETNFSYKQKTQSTLVTHTDRKIYIIKYQLNTNKRVIIIQKIVAIIVMITISLIGVFQLVNSDAIPAQFDIANVAPSAPSAMEVQDGDDTLPNAYDDFLDSQMDTHMIYSDNPYINWTEGTDSNGDEVRTLVCISTTTSGRDNAVEEDGSTCDVLNLYTSATALADPFYKLTNSETLFTYNGASNPMYIRIESCDWDPVNSVCKSFSAPYDAEIDIINSIPSIPSQLNFFTVNDGNPTSANTHLRNPDLDWADFIDADTSGGKDAYPADTLSYTIKIGDVPGGNSRLDTVVYSSDFSGPFNTILDWGSSEVGGLVSQTYYFEIVANDGAASSGAASGTFDLEDWIPNVVNVELSDSMSTNWQSCTHQTCTITPEIHSNVTQLKARITTIDPEPIEDCTTSGAHSAILYLCLNTVSCDPSSSDYSFVLDAPVTSDGAGECNFTFSIPQGPAGTPEFFRAPSQSYLFYVKVTDQPGIEMAGDVEKEDNWELGELWGGQYPGAVTLGGPTIVAGTWSDGGTEYLLENWGNVIMDTSWSSTNPERVGGQGPCGPTNWQWELMGDDFQIDDDNSHTIDNPTPPSQLPPVYITNVAKDFSYATGLNRCLNSLCSDNINETMPTYWHIKPEANLCAGTYESTITLTYSQHV